MEYRRGWRKVHLAIDRTTQEIQAVEMTDQYQADNQPQTVYWYYNEFPPY